MFLLFLLFLAPAPLHGYNVLMANVFCSGSHQTVSGYLANLLADHGHSVTYLSPNIPGYIKDGVEKLPVPDHMDHVLKSQFEEVDQDVGMVEKARKGLSHADHFLRACERWYKEPHVQELMNSERKFDMFVTIGLFDSCSLGLASYLGIESAVITIPVPGLIPNHATMLGLPIYSSSVGIDLLMTEGSAGSQESAMKRVKNLATRLITETIYDVITKWYITPVVKEHVPGYQGYHSLYDNVKLILMHAHPHPLIDGPTPFGPGVVTLGGSICKPYNPDDLAADIREFLDTAHQGFIYISFGSVKPDLNKEEQDKWREVFEKLPYRVVWKQKHAGFDLPNNVRTLSWAPQMTLLQHPNMKLFVTHGGFASKMESLCAGVPLLVIPKFAPDQYYTALRIADMGLGDHITDTPDLDNTSAEQIRGTIEGVVTDEACRERVQRLSRQLMQTKVTDEQVLGYIDAVVDGHRFVPGYQPWYQYFYLDLVLVPVVVIVAVRVSIKKLWRRS